VSLAKRYIGRNQEKKIEAVSAAGSLSVDAKATAIIIFTLFLAIVVSSAECKHCTHLHPFFNKGLHNPTSTSRDVHSQLLQTKAGSETEQTKVKARSTD
jgi:hypothetical protein